MSEFSALEGPLWTHPRGALRQALGSVALAAFVAGCSGDKDDVSLSARIEGAELAVEEGSLASRLTGQFDLVLAVGEYAPDGTSVNAPTFGVVRGDATVLSPLKLSASQSFPLSLEPGRETTVTFTVSANTAIDGEEAAELCAGPVRIRGTMTDSLSGGKQTPVDSAAFDVGCP